MVSFVILLLIGLLTPLSAMAKTSVGTAVLSTLLIYPEQSAPARVESLNDSLISAELTARVQSIPVRVGDHVQKGELLVELDCRQYQSALQASNAAINEQDSQITLSESQLQRAKQLRQQRNVSQEELDRRGTELQVFKARRASLMQQRVQAQLAVERCRLSAPFTGIVRERLVNLGEVTALGRGLIRLQQVDRVEVIAQIDPKIELDEASALTFVYRDQHLPLAVRRVLLVIEPRARTREVRLEFSGQAAPPGSAGRLTWRSLDGHLPGHLLLSRGGELGVMLAKQGQAHFVPLPDAVEGQPARVDLPPDVLVVVEGRHGVNAGDALEIRD